MLLSLAATSAPPDAPSQVQLVPDAQPSARLTDATASLEPVRAVPVLSFRF